MIVADRLFAWVWLDVFQHEDAPVRRDVILRGYSEPHVAIPKSSRGVVTCKTGSVSISTTIMADVAR